VHRGGHVCHPDVEETVTEKDFLDAVNKVITPKYMLYN
jgi:hypothetical protein